VTIRFLNISILDHTMMMWLAHTHINITERILQMEFIIKTNRLEKPYGTRLDLYSLSPYVLKGGCYDEK
jgi:hypothetical protein